MRKYIRVFELKKPEAEVNVKGYRWLSNEDPKSEVYDGIRKDPFALSMDEIRADYAKRFKLRLKDVLVLKAKAGPGLCAVYLREKNQ